MIVIIDYGMGNLHSVLKAFRRIGADAIVSSKKEDIAKAEKLVLPGVGHFKRGMENLREMGLIGALNKKVIEEKTPILGICLGMQLFTKFSEEGDAGGLGWIDAKTIKFNLGDKFRVPHMGWNNIKIEKDNKIFSNLNKEDYFYFVHSFHVNCKNKEDILSITEYGKKFISAIQKENIIGVQFHPEKSHDAGLEILKNFAEET
ncbi:imidazole glycerol phosphate synthase subunit HisH [Candidatus Woesearchaeota archaeon]|nr:imidazole glycerol phosphate synthase subunit HisH [Candidatus Woesearchaeota archaeon]